MLVTRVRHCSEHGTRINAFNSWKHRVSTICYLLFTNGETEACGSKLRTLLWVTRAMRAGLAVDLPTAACGGLSPQNEVHRRQEWTEGSTHGHTTGTRHE